MTGAQGWVGQDGDWRDVKSVWRIWKMRQETQT